jgi:hypothetical protein
MRHLLGLVLGTEEDWPVAFEHLTGRLGPFEWRGATHELATERVQNEPFDLRYRPRYSLVLDRVGWWYLLPREWLKKRPGTTSRSTLRTSATGSASRST